MNLRERYRRLTGWNKLAAWGSVASLLGVLITLTMPVLSPTFVQVSPSPSATAPPSQSVAVTGSSNATVIQAGRDVVVNQPVIVRKVDPTIYKPPSLAVQNRLTSGLQSLVAQYPDLRIQVDVETGSTLRYRVGDTLGTYLEKAGLGGFGRTNTMMGVAPGFAITVWRSPRDEHVAKAAIDVVSAYLRPKGSIDIREREGSPKHQLHFYINGQPHFQEDGSVDIE